MFSSFLPKASGPSFSDMPHSQTIFRARSVATSMSLPAPVVCWPKMISSAMRPPMRIAIWFCANSLDMFRRSSFGSCCVRPSARPRGMIVTLCTGSAPGRSRATSAWPPSWYAVVRFSRSLMIIERRSEPMRTLSLAISKSELSTRSFSLRAAQSAASLTRFSRSAPEKPGVPLAIDSRSTFVASGTLRVWTWRMPSRPRTSGRGTPIETAGRLQRRVEHVGPVRGRNQDDALVRLEAVHLDEELVQRLLALVVAAAQAGAAVTADGVDLVDEDDAGRVLLALLEEV